MVDMVAGLIVLNYVVIKLRAAESGQLHREEKLARQGSSSYKQQSYKPPGCSRRNTARVQHRIMPNILSVCLEEFLRNRCVVTLYSVTWESCNVSFDCVLQIALRRELSKRGITEPRQCLYWRARLER